MKASDLAPDGSIKTIGGWLILPAFLHPIVGVFANLKDIAEVFDTFSTSLPETNQRFLIAVMIVCLIALVGWICSFVLAWKVHPIFPKFYIGLLVGTFLSAAAILATLATVFSVPLKPDDFKELIKIGLGIAIWVPYMVISKRVAATFYGVPFPLKAIIPDSSAPLRSVALRNEVEKKERTISIPQELTMVQRLGLVLYWTGFGVASLLFIGGVVAIYNTRNGSEFVGFALLAAALLSWLVGRGLKFILVGR